MATNGRWFVCRPGTFRDGGHGYARTVPGGEQLGARSQDRVLSCVMAPAAGVGPCWRHSVRLAPIGEIASLDNADGHD